MSNRDDFSPKTKRMLALRASYICSYPGCGQSTVGPSEEASDAVTMIGIAAHICAAAPGPGARRYDPSLTPEQRSSIENGIWLCSNHAVAIDRDDVTFTATMLRDMKLKHEISRSFVPKPNSSEHTDDLIALGPNIIGVGEFVGVDASCLKIKFKHFILGDALDLISYASKFSKLPPDERYVLVNVLGEGRVLSGAPTITKKSNEYEAILPALPSHPRVKAQHIGSSFAQHPDTGDWFVKNGNLARVSGLEALPQKIQNSLGLALGESVFSPKSGTRIAQFYNYLDKSPWLSRLIKMEVIRLASIPQEDCIQKSNRTPLLCVDRVREIEVLADSPRDQRLPVRVILDINGVGRWQHDISIFIHTDEQLREAAPSWLAGASSASFPVGTLISERPPDSSEQAQFGHSAPTLGV
jgi:hypothetical protein